MKALLFDFDGVVIKSMEDHYEGWRRALEEYGIEMIPEELYVLEGQGVVEVAHQLTRKYNLPFDQAPQIIEKKCLYYDQIKKIEFYPYVTETLAWAKEKNLKMAVVTGGDRYRVEKALEDFGLLDYFDAIVTAEDVRQTKPSPEPYLLAASLLECQPADCIVIENAPLGIRSAKAAGMECVAVTTTLAPSFLKQADVVVRRFEQLLPVLKRLY